MLADFNQIEDFRANLERLWELVESEPQFDEIEPIGPVARVQTLDIAGIRRFREPISIDLDSAFTLLYASNGIGKTTLSDALELIKSGRTSRQNAFKTVTTEVRDEPNIYSWGREKEKSYAAITCDDGRRFTWSASGNGDHVNEGKPPYRSFSRLNLRTHLDTKPQDRFEFIRSLLPEQDFNEIVDEAERLHKQLDSTIKFATSHLSSVKERVPDAHFSGTGNIFRQAQDRLERLKRAERTSLDEWTSLESTRQSIGDLLGELNSRHLRETPAPAISVEPTPPVGSESIEALATILRFETSGDVCPLCLDGVLTTARRAEIQQEWAKLAEYRDAKKKFEASRIKHATDLERWRSEKEEALYSLARAKKFVEPADSEVDFETLTVAEIELLNTQLRDRLAAMASDVDKQLSALRARQPLIEIGELEAFIAAFSGWDDGEKSPGDIYDQLEEVAAAESELKSAHAALKLLKDKIMERLLRHIEKPVMHWWRLLTPEHVDFELQFQVKEAKRQGVDIYCLPKIYSKKPRRVQEKHRRHAMGTLSDSQIDRLALAFNFATLGQEIGHGLVWLDDPSDTLDSDNISNFIDSAISELLREGHQVVLCTHSREIVKQVWANYEKIVASSQNIAMSKRFQQVSLDLKECEGDDGYAYPTITCAPFGIESAYKQLKSDISETGNSVEDTFRHGTRLRLSNSMRRTFEFLFSTLIDSFDPFLPADQRRSSPSIGDSNATLGKYRSRLLQILDQLICRVSHSDGVLTSDQENGLIYQLEIIRDQVAGMSSRILNEGSHADLVIPSFQEIKSEWSRLEKLYNQLQKTDNTSGLTEFRVKALTAFYPGEHYGERFERISQTGPTLGGQ